MPEKPAGGVCSEDRDRLLVASCPRGSLLPIPALFSPCPLFLTYYHDLPHGRANGLLMGEYLRYNAEYVPQRVANVLAWLGFEDVEVAQVMGELAAHGGAQQRTL